MFPDMCGRFSLAAKEQDLVKQFAINTLPKLLARYNIVPSQPILAILEDEHTHERLSTYLNWGLIPFWAKDIHIGHKLYNARAETAAQKPAFRGPLRHHRCLIPCSGFYEWQRHDRQKQPYFFRKKDHSLFALAGLWEHWGSADGSEIHSCSLLTTRANRTMAPVHHRMPVIIDATDFALWLDTTVQQPQKIAHLLKPPSEGALYCYPVSTAVNHPENDSPELIKALKPTSKKPLQSDFLDSL